MSKATEYKIKRIYNTLFKKCFTAKAFSKLAEGDNSLCVSNITKLQMSKQFNDFAEKFSKELAKQGLSGTKGVWKRYFDAALKANHIAINTTFAQYEYENMRKAIEHNFKMIKSIPDEFMKILQHKYTSTLIEQVAKGSLGRLTFRKQLEKHGHKNASVVARTESAKLQTAILQSRATELGSKVYQWLASNDKRTRQSHKDMNNVIVFWNVANKPLLDGMRGNAGEFPNCRCAPQPILDETDLIQTNYKVYDYRTDKIITMTKSNLLKAIDNGGLF